MLFQGKEIEVLTKKSVFGKQIAEVKILSTGEVKSVPFSELSDESKLPTYADISFKAIAAKIKSEVFKGRLYTTSISAELLDKPKITSIGALLLIKKL